MIKKVAFLILCLIGVSGCDTTEPRVFKRQIVSFGTTVEVTLSHISEKQADLALAEVEKELHYMHDQWHAWRPSSITRLNQQLQSGIPFEIDQALIPLIQQSSYLYNASLHYFNPAIGKLIELWGFYKDSPQDNARVPEQSAIDQLLISNPNMNDIQLQDSIAQGFNPDIQIDFGGYAKGFGVEQLIHQLAQRGIKNAMVNAGGDIKAIGGINNRQWKVAIEDPHRKQPLGWLYLESGESVFSSGDYRRYFTIDGKNYHHIIDPKSGFPAQHAKGVTVIASDGAIADAAATALMVAPPQDWMKLKQTMKLKHILVVDKDGKLYCDSALAQRLELFSEAPLHILDEMNIPG